MAKQVCMDGTAWNSEWPPYYRHLVYTSGLNFSTCHGLYHGLFVGQREKGLTLHIQCDSVQVPTGSFGKILIITLDICPSQVSESRPIHVTIGESVIKCTGESGWPGSFYKCSIPNDLVSTSDDEMDIKVTFDTLEKSLTLKKGWLNKTKLARGCILH